MSMYEYDTYVRTQGKVHEHQEEEVGLDLLTLGQTSYCMGLEWTVSHPSLPLVKS